MEDKTHIEVNVEEFGAHMSGGGSSMGSQFEVSIDLEVAEDIVKSSLRGIGFQAVPKDETSDHNGGMSLEEDVDSLDIIHLSINEEEYEAMAKEGTDVALSPNNKGKRGDSNQCENGQKVCSAQSNGQNSSFGEFGAAIMDSNAVLDDISDVISPMVKASPVNVMADSGWTVTDGPAIVSNLEQGKSGADLEGQSDKTAHTEHEINISSVIKASSSPSQKEKLSPLTQDRCQTSISPDSRVHDLTKSTSAQSDISLNVYNTPGDGRTDSVPTVSCPLSITIPAQGKVIGVEEVKRQEGSISGSKLHYPEDNSAQHSKKNDGSYIDSEEELSWQILPQFDKQDDVEPKDFFSSSEAEGQINNGCQMIPIEYHDDDCQSIDTDELCISGELIPHGRDSGKGRPKTVPPPKCTVPRNIRSKSELAICNRIPVTLRQDENKVSIEILPTFTEAPLSSGQTSPSLSSSIPFVVNEALCVSSDSDPKPDTGKRPSMECVERDGPVSLRIPPCHGYLAPRVIASEIVPSGQTVLPCQPAHPGMVTSRIITHQHQPLQTVDYPQPTGEIQVRDGAASNQSVRYTQSTYPPQMSARYKNIHVQSQNCPYTSPHHSASVLISQGSSQMMPSYMPEKSRCNLVLADRNLLEQAGIPYIPNDIVTQASVTRQIPLQNAIKPSHHSIHSQKPHFLPQQCLQHRSTDSSYMPLSLGINSGMYHQRPVTNQTAIQLLEPPQYNQISKHVQAGQYEVQPQITERPEFYFRSAGEQNAHLECSKRIGPYASTPIQTVEPSTRVVLPHAKSQSVTRETSSRFCPIASGHLSTVPLEIPREDIASQASDWVHKNPQIPYQHQPSHESLQSIPLAVSQGPNKVFGLCGNEIALPERTESVASKSGPGSKKNPGSARKAVNKSRLGKQKNVNTNNSHQEYISRLPSKKGDITGQTGQYDSHAKVNSTESSSENLAKSDETLRQPVEKAPWENEYNIDPIEQYKSIFEKCLSDSLVEPALSGKPQTETVSNSQEMLPEIALQQQFNIDPNQYLNLKDKESLEKKTNHGKSSLDKYLQTGSSSFDLSSLPSLEKYLHCQEASQVSNCANSLLLENQTCSTCPSDVQLPKQMSKIDIFAWAQQPVALTQAAIVTSKSGHEDRQIDVENPTAEDFPRLLKMFTESTEDEDMKSASIEVSTNVMGAILVSPQTSAFVDGRQPNKKPVNASAVSQQEKNILSDSCNINPTVYVNHSIRSSCQTDQKCFRKPKHLVSKNSDQANSQHHLPGDLTHSNHTSLSPFISNSQSLMANSASMATSQSMSSLKGDSDVSMHSDLSRRSGQNKSMNCFSSKSTQSQDYCQPNNASQPHHVWPKSKSSREKAQRVEEWLEKQSPFPDHIYQVQVSSCQNTHHVSTILTQNPNPTNHIDERDMMRVRQQQHQLIMQAKQQHEQLQKQLQRQQMLQSIPPPSSPQNNPCQDISQESQIGHHRHHVAHQASNDIINNPDDDPYFVAAFSPLDLYPRCGERSSSPRSTRCTQGSASAEDSGSNPSSSVIAQTKTTTTALLQGNGSKSRSSLSPRQIVSKQSTQIQQNSKTISTFSPMGASSTTSNTSIIKSSFSQLVSLSATSAVETFSSKSIRSQLSNTTVVSSHITSIPPIMSPKAKSKESSEDPSNKTDDVIIVGERVKNSVKITQGHSLGKHHQDNDRHDDEEDDEEEEEVSFSGSDVFHPDDQGETILFCLCEMPVDHFDDLTSAPGFATALNLSNKSQQTALFVAVRSCRSDVAEFLIKHGAYISILCISPGNTFRSESLLQSVIHEAAEIGDVKTLNVLLSSDSSVDIDLPRPSSGQSPLMVALHVHSFAHRNPSADRSKVVKLLLTQGASMSIQDTVEGKTPLMYAIQTRDVEIVKLFLRCLDADETRSLVTMRTSRNSTCLHYAAGLNKIDRTKKGELIQILILAGADASARNAEGETPRDWAHDEIAEVFRKLAKRK